LVESDPMCPQAVASAHVGLRARLVQSLAVSWLVAFPVCSAAVPREYSPDALSPGRRALKNLALAYLAAGRHPQAESLAQAQYESARNMTDRMGALSALVGQGDTPAATRALRHFYEQWQHDPLVVDRWFALQATACA